MSEISPTSISLLCATEPCHQRTVAAGQIRLHPHLVVPELPRPFPCRTALVRAPARRRRLRAGRATGGPARARPPRRPARPLRPDPAGATSACLGSACTSGSNPAHSSADTYGRVRHHQVDAAAPRRRAEGRASFPRPAPPAAGGRVPAARVASRLTAATASASALVSVAQIRSTAPAPSSVANASAMAPLPVPASTATRPAPGRSPSRRRASPRATSTTCSVSGRGIRTRGSTWRSRSRKGQWPNTYCSGSPVARRAASARAADDRAGRHDERAAGPRADGEHLVDDEAGLVARPADHRGQLVQQRRRLGAPRLEAGDRVRRPPRRRPRRSDRFRTRRHCPPSSSPSSWRARLSAISASVSSSRSPAST